MLVINEDHVKEHLLIILNHAFRERILKDKLHLRFCSSDTKFLIEGSFPLNK